MQSTSLNATGRRSERTGGDNLIREAHLERVYERVLVDTPANVYLKLKQAVDRRLFR